MADEEGESEVPFESVRAKRKRAKKLQGQALDVSTLIDRRRRDFEPSTYLDDCVQSLKDAFGPDLPKRAICLGLGNLRTANAQMQFLLFDALRVVLDLAEPATFVDPVFDDDDKRYLAERGFRVESSETFDLRCDKLTLCYLPHCPRSVNELLLRSNWTPERLHNLYLLSNTLDTYLLQATNDVKRAQIPCISRIAHLLETTALPHSSDPPPLMERAFADLSFQRIKLSSLPSSDDGAFWTLPAAPVVLADC